MADPGGLTTGAGVPDAILCLVRHAESTWIAEGRFQGRRDPPLSSLGQAQALLLADRLRDRSEAPALPLPAPPPAAIWHSPLERAAATARAVGKAVTPGGALHASEGLSELGQGDWEGLTHAEVELRWPGELSAWREDPLSHQAPRGESLSDGAERVVATVRAVLADLAPGPAGRDPSPGVTYPSPGVTPPSPGVMYPAPWVIVVSHDGILRLALLQLLGVPLERFWSFPFPLCGLSVVEVDQRRTRLRCHGLTDHLTAPSSVDRGGAL